MTVKTTRWDVTEHLDSDESIALFLEAVLEENDPVLLATALGDIARAKGMTELARKAGLSRESLYRALSAEGNPEMATIMKVIGALGLHLTVAPNQAA
ncbi:addiction module antidote protein [Xanthobacter autotrophicus]|uniref:addiction module antidote protein n=1 Tax=Xanthobacter autotrophicus TaxID=280 RepID=UPI00372C1584